MRAVDAAVRHEPRLGVCQQIVSFVRAPLTCGIGQRPGWVVENRLIETPGCFHFVGPNKQGLITLDDIGQQRFVGLRYAAERLVITEVERNRHDLEIAAGDLHVEIELKSLVWLQFQSQHIRFQQIAVFDPEKRNRRLPVGNGDLS